VLLFAALLIGLAPVRATATNPFDECAALVDADPEDLEAWRCYWRLSRRLGRPEEALAALGARIEGSRWDPRGELYRGAILADLADSRAPGSFASASAECERIEAWTCAVYGRLSLAFQLRSDPVLARSELDRALAAAVQSEDPVLTARVRIGQGWRAVHDEQYGRARAAFLAAERELGATGPFDGRVSVHSGLGFVAWATMRLAEASRRYREQARVAAEQGDPYFEAEGLANALYVEELAWREGDARRRPELADYEAVLEKIVRNRDRESEAKLRLLLVQLDLAPERRARELSDAERAAREAGAAEELAAVQRLGAADLARNGQPEIALERLEEGIRIARSARVREEILRGELRAPFLLWQLGARREALARAESAVEGLEKLLWNQPLARDRAGLELHWVDAAYALARLLIENGESDLGLEILERLRNRSVLEGLATAAAGVSGTELESARAEIGEAQADLIRLGSDSPERRRALARIATLEAREEELLGALGALKPGSPATVPTVARLRSALAQDTALVGYQIPVWSDPHEPGSQAWQLVITRDGVRWFEIPGRPHLRRWVDSFEGLLERGGPHAERVAIRLYGELLAPALSTLGPDIRRLVLVPDGPLHGLAFEALVPAVGEPPLGMELEIMRVPSFVSWLAAHDPPRPERPRAALVLADPALGAGRPASEALGREGAIDPARLGRLAGARREAERLSELFGDRSRVLVDSSASESALKRADLSGVGLLHVAAHAVVDDLHPYRSAILLAPGDGEDGFLQMRDIVELELGGTIVVLAACRSADGSRSASEGVFSLARAFLDAGAGAVVANLRVLDDAESQRLLDPFFRALERGDTLGAALREARRRARADGSSSAWATTVLLGDGGVHLRAPQRRRAGRAWALAAAAVICGGLGLGALALRRRADRPAG
jgi:CHAT domain-containing protein